MKMSIWYWLPKQNEVIWMNDGYIDWRLKIEDGSIKRSDKVTNYKRKKISRRRKKIFLGKN